MSDSPLREIMGTFNGWQFLGNDGKEYPVPGNYASKSKLVVGDKLKLAITENGFIFKQIGPVERRQFIGTIINVRETFDAEELDSLEPQLLSCKKTVMVTDGQNVYKILQPSVSYYNLKEGDEVVAVVPQFGEARIGGKGDFWAAIDAPISQKR